MYANSTIQAVCGSIGQPYHGDAGVTRELVRRELGLSELGLTRSLHDSMTPGVFGFRLRLHSSPRRAFGPSGHLPEALTRRGDVKSGLRLRRKRTSDRILAYRLVVIAGRCRWPTHDSSSATATVANAPKVPTGAGSVVSCVSPGTLLLHPWCLCLS